MRNFLRGYLKFIKTNSRRAPNQHVSAERSLYQKYQRAKRRLPNERCQKLQNETDQALSPQRTFEAWFKSSQSLDGCEGIVEEYLQFVRAHGRAPRRYADAKAERALYQKYSGHGAQSIVNRKLSNAYALKLRCDINKALKVLRGTHLTADKREGILRRYFAFINTNHGRPPCQYSVGTERSLYQHYQRAKQKLQTAQ